MSNEPRFSITSLFREHFSDFQSRHGVRIEEHRAAQAMIDCRSERLGRYEQRCDNGHVEYEGFHSCHHRSCARCNGSARHDWLDRIQSKLLPISHFHVIFTLPHEINDLWMHNRVWFSTQIFSIASESLKALLRDPRHLGAEPSMLLAQHTWGRTLVFHPHVHALVSSGGLSGSRWLSCRPGYLVPGRALATLYRGKWLGALNQALGDGALHLPPGRTEAWARRQFRTLARKRWNVRIEGRYDHGKGVAVYLSRYVRGGPMRDQRLAAMPSGQVSFLYRDHRDHQTKTMTLTRDAFMGRLLSHVPPERRHVIRYYGLYHSRASQRLDRARSMLPEASAPMTKPVAIPPTCKECRSPLKTVHYRRDENSLIRKGARRYVQQRVQADAPTCQSISPSAATGPPLFFLSPGRAA